MADDNFSSFLPAAKKPAPVRWQRPDGSTGELTVEELERLKCFINQGQSPEGVMNLEISKARNGYILAHRSLAGGQEVFPTLDELLQRLLAHYEGRADCFSGSSYGKVNIERGREEE